MNIEFLETYREYKSRRAQRLSDMNRLTKPSSTLPACGSRSARHLTYRQRRDAAIAYAAVLEVMD